MLKMNPTDHCGKCPTGPNKSSGKKQSLPQLESTGIDTCTTKKCEGAAKS